MRDTMKSTLAGSLALAAFLGCAPMPEAGVVYIERQPPAERVEVIGVAPSPGLVWVAGYWEWGGDDYVWVPGRWMAPEPGHRSWERGNWRHHGRGWYWAPGHWR
jgi:YXWGXW repeat-containing protein